MHRKVIAALLTSCQSSGAINSFRLTDSEAKLSQATLRFRYNRKSSMKFCFSPFLCLFSVTTLFAALDPDIFDGRITEPSSDSESNLTASSPESGGGEFGDSGSEDGSAGVDGTEGDEQRDLESVGGTGGGKAVENSSSKFSSSSGVGSARSGSAETLSSDSRESTTGGGAYGEATSKDEASSVGGGSGGSSSTEASGEPSGGSGFASQEPRNFEDFGFGGAGTQEIVEVNRSKESTAPASLSSGNSTIPQKVNDFTTAAGQEATGGSQAGNGSLGVDYGTNLPSGL